MIIILALLLGITLTIPIGGADMPVVISLLNSYSGIAGAATGFVLENNILIISGSLVGASGLILTRIMTKAKSKGMLQRASLSIPPRTPATTTEAVKNKLNNWPKKTLLPVLTELTKLLASSKVPGRPKKRE